jgi:selenocysteine-specific elongation factor
LSEKGSHLLYAGTAETPVRVRLRDGSALQAGHEGLAQLHLRDALPLARGDHFVLRDAGRVLTFGGGEILDPLPGPARRGDERRLGLLHASIGASPQEMVTMLVDAEGRVPRSVALLRAGADRVPEDVISLGDLLVSRDSFDAIGAALRSALEEHHRARPLEPGMPREAARAAVDLDPRSFDALLERLEDVEGRGATVTLVGHRVALAPQEEAERKRLLEVLDEGGFSPPMTKDLGADPALLRALTDAGDVVKVGDFYLSSGRAAEARTKVRAALEERGPLTVAEIRDLLGTTRKYAVPLCEWLDDTGATLRRGDLRHPGPHP